MYAKRIQGAGLKQKALQQAVVEAGKQLSQDVDMLLEFYAMVLPMVTPPLTMNTERLRRAAQGEGGSIVGVELLAIQGFFDQSHAQFQRAHDFFVGHTFCSEVEANEILRAIAAGLGLAIDRPAREDIDNALRKDSIGDAAWAAYQRAATLAQSILTLVRLLIHATQREAAALGKLGEPFPQS